MRLPNQSTESVLRTSSRLPPAGEPSFRTVKPAFRNLGFGTSVRRRSIGIDFCSLGCEMAELACQIGCGLSGDGGDCSLQCSLDAQDCTRHCTPIFGDSWGGRPA